MQVNHLSRCIKFYSAKKIKSTKFYSNFPHPYITKIMLSYPISHLYIYVKNKFENQKQKSTPTTIKKIKKIIN